MTEPVPAAEGTAKKPQFAIQRLYCKDISFEAPGTPGIFTQNWEPDTNVQFSSAATKVSDMCFAPTVGVRVLHGPYTKRELGY